MNKAYIDPKKCDSSPMCPARKSCPEKAITQEKLGLFKLGLFKRGVAVVDRGKVCFLWRVYKNVPPWSDSHTRTFGWAEESKKEKEEITDQFLQKFEVGILIRYNYELGNS